MRQIFLFIAILLATAANAQRHTPVEIKQLAYRKLPNGQKPLGLDLDKYITSYLVKNGGGGGGSVPDTVLSQAIYESITYTALAAKVADSTLTVGKRYLISDFKTVFNLNVSGTAYTDATVEPIVVTALTTSSLDPIAFSPTHPKDIIYYDVDGSTYMPGSTKGCIYRRIDTEKNINVPFDFREFKVEVANVTTPNEYDNGVTYAKGDIVFSSNNIKISLQNGNTGNDGDALFWKTILDKDNDKTIRPISFFNGTINNGGTIASPNLAFNIGNSYNFVINKQPEIISGTLFFTSGYFQNCTFDALDNCVFNSEETIFNNHCGIISNYILRSGQFSDNKLQYVAELISSNFRGNDIGISFVNNCVETADNNTIAASATGNIIGDNFKDNTIGIRFQNNTIGTNFGNLADNYGNQIGNDFHDNVILDNFSGNVIGNWFYANTVGNDCQYNNLLYKFYSNITGNNFQNWNGQYALSGVDFTALAFFTANRSKFIVNDAGEGLSHGHFDNGVLVLTAF